MWHARLLSPQAEHDYIIQGNVDSSKQNIMLFSYIRDGCCFFYPRDAVLARALAVVVCLSVCLSVKSTKRMITQTTPRDSHNISKTVQDSLIVSIKFE